MRIWREIINAFTCMQGPFSIALSGAGIDRRVRELARDHFGGTPERIVVEDTEAALQAVIDGDATLAVLPWDDRVGEWFGMMIGATEAGLRICFCTALRACASGCRDHRHGGRPRGLRADGP